MRKLKTGDIPVLCRTLKKLEVKDKIRAIAQEADTVRDIWEKGFDLVWDLFDVATEASGEMAIYEFLAGPFEMEPEQIKDLDLDILVQNLQQLAEENNLLVFFKLAAKSMR